MSEKKVVFITAAAGSMGESQARLFSNNGYKVFLTDIDEEKLINLSNELKKTNSDVSYSILDVRYEESWTKSMDLCMNVFNSLDVLCNNAGSNFRTGFENQTLEMWDNIISIGLTGVFLGIKTAVEKMKINGGVIINLGSLATKSSSESSPGYSAQKMGLVGLTKSAAIAFSKYNIRCNLVSPGHVDTPFIRSNNDYSPNDWTTSIDNPENYNKRLKTIPLGRFLNSDDIANTILFLSSENASMITGENILIDGGTSLV
jgi:NAD(P)-dependent dehydrogenase (short-subunit alcohol dehydrogenase family)